MNLTLPVLPRRLAPEIVDVEHAAPHQIVAQAFDLARREADRTDIGHEREGIFEDRVVEERDDDVLRRAVPIAPDAPARQLREAGHEVDVGIGVVGVPAIAGTLGADALIEDATKCEEVVRWSVRLGESWRNAVPPSTALAERDAAEDEGRKPEGYQPRPNARRAKHVFCALATIIRKRCIICDACGQARRRVRASAAFGMTRR